MLHLCAAAAVPGGMRSRTVAVGTLAGGVVSVTGELCFLTPPRDFALRFCVGCWVSCLHGTSNCELCELAALCTTDMQCSTWHAQHVGPTGSQVVGHTHWRVALGASWLGATAGSNVGLSGSAPGVWCCLLADGCSVWVDNTAAGTLSS
jgi:hypothetical protein